MNYGYGYMIKKSLLRLCFNGKCVFRYTLPIVRKSKEVCGSLVIFRNKFGIAYKVNQVPASKETGEWQKIYSHDELKILVFKLRTKDLLVHYKIAKTLFLTMKAKKEEEKRKKEKKSKFFKLDNFIAKEEEKSRRKKFHDKKKKTRNNKTKKPHQKNYQYDRLLKTNRDCLILD